jgi:hypothetical protein
VVVYDTDFDHAIFLRESQALGTFRILPSKSDV